MGIRYKSYQNMAEADKWKCKITNYYARWLARHIKALVCDRLLLKDVNMSVNSGWGSSYSTFKVTAEALPVSSAFLGAKQMMEQAATIKKFFGTYSKDDARCFTRVESIYLWVESQDKDSSWHSYRGMLCASLGSMQPIFEIVELDKERELLETPLDLSAWLLEKEITRYDLEVELKLEIPFLK